MLTDYISLGGSCEKPKKTVDTLDDLKSTKEPYDGMTLQVLSYLPDFVVSYVFNTDAESGIPSDDGTAGFWNVYVNTPTSKVVRLIFHRYIPKGKIIDLLVLPIGTNNVFNNSLSLGENILYHLNDVEVVLTKISDSSFILDKAIYNNSKLELIPKLII